MSDLNQQIKEQAAPGVLQVIEWALKVHEDTMSRLEGRTVDRLDEEFFTLDQREEARKILLEYGAGKPARVMIHQGSKKNPIQFETNIVKTEPKQLTEPDFIEAEVVL